MKTETRESRREESEIEEDKEYPCVFYPKITCPIRTMWKLKPESLQGFCVACKDIYIVAKLAQLE